METMAKKSAEKIRENDKHISENCQKIFRRLPGGVKKMVSQTLLVVVEKKENISKFD